MDFINFLNTINATAPTASAHGRPIQSKKFSEICFKTDEGLKYNPEQDKYLIDDHELRRIEIKPNISGHISFQLVPGDGYLLTIYDLKNNKESLTTRPVRLIEEQGGRISFRGYPVIFEGPFGDTELDFSDYGITVFHKEGRILGCILHRYDSNSNYAYGLSSNLPECTLDNFLPPPKVSQMETFVKEAISNLKRGNDGDAVYHPLYKAWREFKYAPDKLKEVKDYGSFGMGMMIFLSYGTISDIDIKQQIATISYLFLSMAIEDEPENVNYRKNRVMLIEENLWELQFTVANILDEGNFDIFSITSTLSQFNRRDALYKMQYYDLISAPALATNEYFFKIHCDLTNKVKSGFFNQVTSNNKIYMDGRKHHEDMLEYLKQRVFEDQDIDF